MAIGTVVPPQKAAPRRLRWRSINATTYIGASMLFLLIVITILAPVLSPYSPNANSLGEAFQLPSGAHWLGTDQLGRDILSRIMYGGRVSLVGVLQATVVYIIVGVFFGVLAGYVGGVLDAIIVWVAEVSFSLPAIIIVLTVLALFSNDATAAMVLLGLLGAPGLAVFIRGVTRSVRGELFVSAARVSGLGPVRIMVRHIFPQISAPLLVQVSVFASTALLFQTGLDFLGLATQPPTATWGSMVADGSVYLGSAIWMVMPPGFIIVFAVLSIGLVSDGLQDMRVDRMRAVQGTPRTDDFVEAARVVTPSTPQAPAASSVLSVRGLSANISDQAGHPVIEDVSFDLAPGGCVGIVGESGSGKTITALATIGLLPRGLEVTAGRVLFHDRDLLAGDERSYAQMRGSGIAMISQEPVANLDPSFSVGQQISEVLRRHRKVSRRESKRLAMELLTKVKLPNPELVYRRYPHQLSGGMAQRVLIATALAGEPEVLIADEPTTALDVSVQAEILQLLRELRAEMGLAVILVSHDWGVIADSCDSVVVMYAGQVVEDAPVEEVFSAPKHPYSHALMMANPHRSVASREPLPVVAGTVPPIGSWPSGCHFADRCAFVIDDCRKAPIPLLPVDTDHDARCIRSESVPRMTESETMR